MHDISLACPEMASWSILEAFCTQNRYLNPFRSIFMTFEKIAFFRFSFVGFGHFGTRRIFYGFKTGRISAGTYSYTPWPFPKKMGPIRSGYLQNAIGICDPTLFSQNSVFWQSVAFVAFVAFWGTTMLFFGKFNIRAFRKVYGLWGYLQPIKSYLTLKLE